MQQPDTRGKSHSDIPLSLIQKDSEWWKTEPRVPTPPKDGNLAEVVEEEENKVEELYSLGRLFNELADADPSHEQVGTSKAAQADVNPSSSDLELIGQITRLTVHKVPFSHLAAHLDKNLSLKKTQHEASLKRKTQASSGELSDSLSYHPSSCHA